MSDLRHALNVARRLTPLEWAHHVASCAIIAAWTVHALGYGGW